MFLNCIFGAFFECFLALKIISGFIKEMHLLIKEAKISRLRHFKGDLSSLVFS